MLQISHLAASYGGKPALEDINLTLDSGELLVVLGPSGCGKTTLLNLIAGFVPYQHGSITLAGKRVDGPGADRGVVFQNEGLLPWRNVQDNVAFGLQLAGVEKVQRQRIAQEMLQKVGLEDAGKRFIWQLSGGQRQRVGIARALANSPDELLCDEATSALDPQTTDQILDLLLDINRRFNLTIVLITHEMHVVRKICDRVAVMENGKVVEEGDVLSVFTHPQQPITQQFVRQVSQYAEEETFNTELANDLEGTVIRLTFTGHSTHRPIVGELTLRYGLPFNILHGKMTQTAHGVFGQLWVHVVASDEQLNNILADLKQSDIEGEVIKHG